MVKATKSATGYTLTLDDKTVEAVRQPDMYFVILLGETKHKGYLKDLKARFAAWAQGTALPPAPAKRQTARSKFVPTSTKNDVRDFVDVWVRKDKETGALRLLTHIDCFATFHNQMNVGSNEQYDSDEEIYAAMAKATKDKPMANQWATYWPEKPHEVPVGDTGADVTSGGQQADPDPVPSSVGPEGEDDHEWTHSLDPSEGAVGEPVG